MSNVLKRYFLCYILTISVFSFGLILVYLIPNSALELHYSKSLSQIEKEEMYPNFLFDADGSILDNFMDKNMILSCRASDVYSSPIIAAFDNNGYPRYWNGYLLTLRPLLTQFTYQQIRYINMFILLICFCFCFSGIHNKLNPGTAFGFAAAVIACFLVFVGESLQYFSVFLLLFIILLLILYIPRFQITEYSALLFFGAGMLTNFFDMLTAPLLTLGIPLIVILSLNCSRRYRDSFRSQMSDIFIHSVSWCFGYGLCWFTKWVLATLILGANIFDDAFKTARFRVYGNEAYPLDRSLMFRLNFETYFFAKGHKPAVFLLLVIILLIVLLLKNHRENWNTICFSTLIIGIFPYIWYFVFANHSQLHYFYTYRIQAVTLFSAYAAISNAIDWKNIHVIKKYKNNK